MIARIVALTGLACLSAGAFANGSVTSPRLSGLIQRDVRQDGKSKWRPINVWVSPGGSVTAKFVSPTEPASFNDSGCSGYATLVPGVPHQSEKKGWVTVVTISATASFRGRCIMYGHVLGGPYKKLYVNQTSS